MLYRLGAVPYLNALPLIHYLPEKQTLAPPAALSRLLKIGEVDIATAPIVTLFENPHYTLVPGICIASRGAVKSVKLFFRSPEVTIENVRSIYLDMESKTSALLLKVLLKFKYRRDLNDITFYHPLPPREMEAKLLIGDKAMREVADVPPVDLGYEWTAWTGLPFVYAAWVSRLPEVSDRAIEDLQRARNEGVSHIESLLPPNTPFPRSFVEEYLKNFTYTLGPEEQAGMRRFETYLQEAGFHAVR